MTSNPDFRALEPVAPLPLADAVATAEGECLHFLATETGRLLTPDLIESLYGQFRGVIAGLVDALAQAEEPAASLPLADTHYEWELEDANGEWQASGSSNSQSDVECEGMRYLQGYAQDGAHKLIIRRHTTQTINEITNG